MIKRSESGSREFAGDIAIELDRDGLIRSVRFGREMADDAAASTEGWMGSSWLDTVSDDTRDKAARLLAEAARSGVTGFRQIEQALPGGVRVPVEYAAVQSPEHTGVVLLGRDLRGVAELQRRYVEAQQSLERDYWKLRQVETRYRMIFRESLEPGVVVDPETMRVLDANPAAMEVLGLGDSEPLSTLVGRSFVGEIGPDSRDAFRGHVAAVARGVPSRPVRVALGPDRLPALARASASRQGSDVTVFLRFALLDDSSFSVPIAPARDLTRVVETLPDGFVLVDADGQVLFGNASFADLVEVAPAALEGRQIQEWLERPGADWTVLRSTLERHGSVRVFSSTIVGDLGQESEVELSAAPVDVAGDAWAGIVIRDVGRRITEPRDSGWLNSEAPDIASQVGKTTLAGLVEEVVAEVERELIEAALEMTGGNRTAAAELLGLSRQSLYSRLDRYGFNGRRG